MIISGENISLFCSPMADSKCNTDRYMTYPTKMTDYLPKIMNRTIQMKAVSQDSSL